MINQFKVPGSKFKVLSFKSSLSLLSFNKPGGDNDVKIMTINDYNYL